MLTLDTIRAALADPDPYTEMDRLVRAEQASGRRVKDILNSLGPLADMILDAPGLTRDGEEALLGALDALTGDCDPDQWYRDPPDTSLPSEAEVAALPRWARVAFAARCARRVLPLFRTAWPDAPREYAEAVKRAIEVAERSAASASVGHGATEVARAADVVADAADAISSDGYAAAVAAAAANAADEVVDPTQAAFNSAVVAFLNAVAATARFDGTSAAIAHDRHLITERVRFEEWDDEAPVSPDVFGPLWPEGPPPGWPADPDTPVHTGVELDLLVGERVKGQVAGDEAVHLFNALSRYHVARTGRPLQLDDLRPYLPIRAAVGV